MEVDLINNCHILLKKSNIIIIIDFIKVKVVVFMKRVAFLASVLTVVILLCFNCLASPIKLTESVCSRYENHSGISITGLTNGLCCSASSVVKNVVSAGGSTNMVSRSYAYSVQIQIERSKKKVWSSPVQTGYTNDPWVYAAGSNYPSAVNITSNLRTNAKSYHFTSVWDGANQLGSHGYVSSGNSFDYTVYADDAKGSPIIEIKNK